RARLTGHKKPVRALVFVPGRPLLASAGLDGTVRFWDVESSVECSCLDVGIGTLTALAASPDGMTVAVGERTVSLGELKEKVLRIVSGQKIAYVTDAGYTPANIEAIVDLVRSADTLFIETAFTHEEERRAAEKYHLTARQAGWLARRAGAKRLVPFHFSPKHTEEGDRLVSEGIRAFEGLD
ncbi:MAG TPA: MBL fold metallo-hydrolase, partial [Thermoanaerobaculia bacterium]